MIAGLVSVTFRQKSVAEICALISRAGLKCVEWGGDVHVTDIASARAARDICRDSGIEICSYGSYFRVGEPISELEKRVEIARELGCGVVRVWCGSKGSAGLAADEHAAIVDSLMKCCDTARGLDAMLALEFHGGTLTDSLTSLSALISETHGADNLRFLWQPRWDWSEGDRLAALDMIGARLSHAHVFTWRHALGGETQRMPLASGIGFWEAAAPKIGGAPALLEFVEGDSERAFFGDAETLRQISRL